MEREKKLAPRHRHFTDLEATLERVLYCSSVIYDILVSLNHIVVVVVVVLLLVVEVLVVVVVVVVAVVVVVVVALVAVEVLALGHRGASQNPHHEYMSRSDRRFRRRCESIRNLSKRVSQPPN
ncbi:hypothetical protein ElyMa_001477400 [Elysia marginata]|uniref:Uncharacterized protein n=1 Tax=Elysia marginata TaxID=1093978 RepID=A0AAV4J591_9GAST|nr:hypothetical protein ElyMa_001477400 [Elysia marginata]